LIGPWLISELPMIAQHGKTRQTNRHVGLPS
jgi:hypothetical protein